MLRRIASLTAMCVGASMVMMSLLPESWVVKPTSPREAVKVSAFIGMASSAGSGVVLNSSKQGSEILTNQHVCVGAVKEGAFVEVDRKRYWVDWIQPSKDKDLCIMHVRDDLHVNSAVSPTKPEFGEEVMTAGHPVALPIVVQKGYLSYTFKAYNEIVTLSSLLVQPGSSGSPVWNSRGELIGLAEEFKEVKETDSIGFALLVPWHHVKEFVEIERRNLPHVSVPDARTK